MQISEMLEKIKKEKLISFHMPGHKGRVRYLDIKDDVTEFDGTDNLYDPKQAILNTQLAISKFYNSKKSYMGVNGSTGLIHVAINSAFNSEDKILIERSAHISVFNATFFKRIDFDTFSSFEELEEIYNSKASEYRGVIITTPNVKGQIADFSLIDKIRDKWIVIADEAHGADLVISSRELSAINHADIVVHSFHKSLPALTSSAVIHIYDKIDTYEVEKYLKIFQTTSPSYLILRSIDESIEFLSTKAEKEMEELLDNIDNFLKRLEGTGFRRKIFKYYDRTRIFLEYKYPIDYRDVEIKLRDRSIQIEASLSDGLVVLTSMLNQECDFIKLSDALIEIDREVRKVEDISINELKLLNVEKVLPFYRAYQNRVNLVKQSESVGKICSEIVTIYPPGVALILPGERIKREHLDILEKFSDKVKLTECNYISVVGDRDV